MATKTTVAKPFRDTIRQVSPRWLRSGLAEKILYAVFVHADLIGQGTVDGVAQRFPDAAFPDALSLLSADRRINRGPSEGASVFAARLKRWLDDHRVRGGPYPLLHQTGLFWNNAFDLVLIYTSGRKFTRDTSGTITRGELASGDVSGSADGWPNWWLVFTGLEGAEDGLWQDPGTWSDGGTWDTELSVETVENLRTVPRNWNAAHAIGHLLLMSGSSELWDYPEGTWDEPGGTWGPWSDGGVAELLL